MNSHNHPMFGSVGAWFYQALAGINVEADSVGYRCIRIEPQIVRDLMWVSATVDTVRGTVSSSWTHSPGAITLDVVIPVNSDAKIAMPKEEHMKDVVVRESDRVVWENGKYVSGVPGVTDATQDKNGSIVVQVGSGRYAFRLTEQ